MSPVVAQLLLGLAVALIERGPEAFAAAASFARGVRALFTEDRDPTSEELAEIMRRAFEAGADLRETVIRRLLPGGDWHGQVELPPEITELVEIAQGRVAGS